MCPGEPGPGPLPPGSTVQGLPWGAGPSDHDHVWPGPPLACLPVALRDEHHSQGRGTSWDRAPRPVPRAQTDTWLRHGCFLRAPSQVPPRAGLGGTEAVTGTRSCPPRPAGAGPRVGGWTPVWTARPTTASGASSSVGEAGGAQLSARDVS